MIWPGASGRSQHTRRYTLGNWKLWSICLLQLILILWGALDDPASVWGYSEVQRQSREGIVCKLHWVPASWKLTHLAGIHAGWREEKIWSLPYRCERRSFPGWDASSCLVAKLAGASTVSSVYFWNFRGSAGRLWASLHLQNCSNQGGSFVYHYLQVGSSFADWTELRRQGRNPFLVKCYQLCINERVYEEVSTCDWLLKCLPW